ncbi:14632_t:CDS:2 [Ambispora leptoticha]|uniref:14632_t:CDS:1 n=1 Tax=Ambispora leptoticha TaxID=144679 RepID=A0A9N8VL00_9GLOM|nr:14632_t:CDS:2 [Ambispora leptoticha]
MTSTINTPLSQITEEQDSKSSIPEQQISKDNNNTLNASSTAVGTRQSPTTPTKTPSAATKLVNKFATFTPSRMKNKGSDRQLIVETAYCGKKDSQQSDLLRPAKSTETMQKPKKKKRTPNITEGMSRAEIFAANVASAVDAAEAEPDEDEDFIYGDRGHTRTPSLTSTNSGGGVGNAAAPNGNGINQQPPPPTFTYPHMPPDHNNYGYPPNHHAHYQYPGLYVPASLPNSRRPFYGGGVFYSNGSTPGSDTDDGSNRKGTTPNNLLSPTHKPTGVMRASLPDMSQYSKGHPNYGATGYYYNDPFYHDWYGVGDDERLPLFAKWRPPYEDQRRTCCTSTTFSLTTFLIFSIVAFCYLIYFASSQPLTEVAIIDIANVLAADKELMFDMYVRARNLDIWDVKIMDADIKSLTESAPSELGQILNFDEPLVFQASTNRTGVVQVATAQVTLRNPGGKDDQEAQENWSYLLRQGFQLTVRGILKYSLPFSKDQVARLLFGFFPVAGD